MIKVGILGAAGYAGGELIRVLVGHPDVEIVFANSESHAGHAVAEVHEGLYGDTDLKFTSAMPFDEVEVVFFCFGHGKSAAFLQEHDIPAEVKIIDFAQDFRLAAVGNDFVYGLPELQREKIKKAHHVANPGCFATCIQLGLLPLAAAGMLKGDVSVNAITGSTGAGVKPTEKTHFSWRSGNMSIYKAFRHQHVPEIVQSLQQLEPVYDGKIEFLPYRGDFPRGIFATEVVRTDVSQEKIDEVYGQYFADSPFTFYLRTAVDMKQVVNTNKCLIHAERIDDKLLITSCIDNLLKGAAGQAVENMNLMFGLPEERGLRLKAVGF
jgi:N-acetyl-gamma-glutamyl-phosphate reductase